MRKNKKTLGSSMFDIANNVFMAIIIFIMLYPFIYVVNYSLSDMTKVRGNLLLLPVGINVDAYQSVFRNAQIPHSAMVSVGRALVGPGLMLIVMSMASYALCRENLVGRKALNKYFIFTMYFSGGMIPIFLLMKMLGLLGSFWVYILPGLSNAFYLVLIRTYMEGLPIDLEEAALIDGAGYFLIYARIIFPLCMPVLAAVAMFSMVGHWNSFIDVRLYNSMEKDLFTLQYVLYNYLNSTTSATEEQAQALGSTYNAETVKMAITTITVLPILCVYPLLQRYFVSGLLIGSVKG